MKRFLALCVFLMCAAAAAVTLKTWTTTETLTATDLNTNFSRLNAALPTTALLIKGVGKVTNTTGALSSAGGNVTASVRTGAGVYTVTYSTTITFGFAIPQEAAAGDHRQCNAVVNAGTTATVRCFDDADIATDTTFVFIGI